MQTSGKWQCHLFASAFIQKWGTVHTPNSGFQSNRKILSCFGIVRCMVGNQIKKQNHSWSTCFNDVQKTDSMISLHSDFSLGLKDDKPTFREHYSWLVSGWFMDGWGISLWFYHSTYGHHCPPPRILGTDHGTRKACSGWTRSSGPSKRLTRTAFRLMRSTLSTDEQLVKAPLWVDNFVVGCWRLWYLSIAW